MARPVVMKVNKHVIYYGANCKPRPATVTNVVSPTVVDLRVLHTGEVHLAVSQQVVGKAANTWKVY